MAWEYVRVTATGRVTLVKDVPWWQTQWYDAYYATYFRNLPEQEPYVGDVWSDGNETIRTLVYRVDFDLGKSASIVSRVASYVNGPESYLVSGALAPPIGARPIASTSAPAPWPLALVGAGAIVAWFCIRR